MLLAKVAGTVVTAKKEDRIDGSRYLMLKTCDTHGEGEGDHVVALDLLGSAPGEVVLVSQGSSCRQTAWTKDKPVDAVILGIVDLVEENDKVVFRK